MKLTPLDIKKQEFKRTLRGFDCVEVETFLEMVADEYEQLLQERNQLAEQVNKLQTQLQDYQQVEKTLRETLMSAQETVERSRRNSEKEAALIIHEAEIKAEKILEKAKMELAETKNELMLIKAEKESFAKRLKHLLQSQLELLEVLEAGDLNLLLEKTKPSPRKATVAEEGSPDATQTEEQKESAPHREGSDNSNQLIV